jgi:DNA-binding MarR family transcriptional regulator
VRDGFELVDFAEVGLPVFRLSVEAVTVQRTSMPTMEEFVLRAIEIGESDPEEIARLLGLAEPTVEDCLETLAYDELIAVQSDDGNDSTDRYLVTELGQERLAQGERVHRDETLVFDYDGVRRRPVRLGNESLFRAAELAERSAFQIRPHPFDPPKVDEISLNEIVPAVRRLSDKPFERTLLAIRRIVRRQTLFRPAVGLVFRSTQSDEHQIGFAIGNTLANEHEMAFARHGGVKRPGLIKTQPSQDGRNAIRRRLGPVLHGSLADQNDVNRLRRSITVATEEQFVVNAKRERIANRPKQEMRDQLDPNNVEAHLRNVRGKLDALGLRNIAPYELPEMFNEALDSCRRRLLITSTTIDAQTCHAYVVRRIIDRLAEDVEIRIETSKELDVNPKGKKGAFEPAIQLWSESQMKVGLALAQRPQEVDEVFFLIKDDDLAVISDRPFLNSDVRRKCFTPWAAVATRLPHQVRAIAALAGLGETNLPDSRRKQPRD